MEKPIFELPQPDGSSVWADLTTRTAFQDVAVTFRVAGEQHRLEAYHTQEERLFAAALGVCLLQEPAARSAQLREVPVFLAAMIDPDEDRVGRPDEPTSGSPGPLAALSSSEWWSMRLGLDEPYEWSLRASEDGVVLARADGRPLTVVWPTDWMAALLAGLIWRTYRVGGRVTLSRAPTDVYVNAVEAALTDQAVARDMSRP